MSSNDKLSVSIGADKTDFDKKIKEVEFDIKELSKVKLEKLKLGLDTTEINAQIKDAKASLNTLKTTVKDTGNTFSKDLAPKVANGGNALMQFSRIAQDAPFGIMGIGNNITATAEAFGYLKQQTGSTGGALKALGSSILGTGGILLGVSLLTTGLTLLAQSGLSVGDVVDKITGKFNAARAEIEKLNIEASKQSGSEIANMKALVSVAQDDNISREKRLIAVKELQKEFPAYFGNLNTEKILNGDLTGVTNELTSAIIARAKATAYSGKLGELVSEELKLNYKLIKAKEDLAKAEKEVAKDVAKTVKNMSDETAAATQGGVASAISRNSIRNDLREIRADLAKNKASQDIYSQSINKTTAESIKLKEEATKPVKTFNTPQVKPIENLLTPITQFAPLNPIDDKDFKDHLIGTANTLDVQLARMKSALMDFNDNANQIISSSIASTFANLGSAIGEAVATGGNVLEAVGATLLGSLGAILTEMGKMAIQIGVSLIAIKFALKSLNPAVAIAAGVALIALGSVFSHKSASIGNSIGGGGNASGNSGAGANNNSFTSSGFSSNQGGGTVVFEIAGQKLIGVLSNTINANRRLGGSLGIG